MPSGSRLPLALVLLVVLGLLVVAPAAGSPVANSSGDDTLGGALDSDSSSTDSGSDSTTTNVTDSDTTLSSDSSTSDSSTSDSTDSSTSDSTDSSTSDSTDSSTSGSATDSSGSSDSDDGTDGSSTESTADLYDISLVESLDGVDGSLEGLTAGSLDVSGDGEGSAEALKLRDARRLDRLSRLEYGATAGVSETTDDLVVQGTLEGLTGLETLSTSLLEGSEGEASSEVGPPRAATGRETGLAPATSNLQLSGAAGDDGIPAPGPTGGVALGIGAVAAAGAARQWGSTPALLSGLGATMASVAPATSRWGGLDRLVRTIAPFRYSRYDDSDPLEHEARETVFELVQEAPGAYLSEVSDGADLPLSTARHHVRVLEQEDLVTGAKVRGKRRFYPAYTEGIELTAAMNDEATAVILDAIAHLGASSVSDLAGELDRDPSTISHHLQRLESDDLIVRERDGRAVLNRLSADARTALEPDRQPVEAASESITAGGAD